MKGAVLKGKRVLSIAAAAFLVFFITSLAMAKTTAKEEQKLTTEITSLDKDAAMPNGRTAVMDRLSKEFKVTADKITALRDKNLGYGEIAAIYALADKLPGGITDENVSKVTSLRKSDKGWSTIATTLNVDLGKVTGKVKGIEKDVHRDIKKASTETRGEGSGAGSGAGGGFYDGGRYHGDASDPLYQ